MTVKKINIDETKSNYTQYKAKYKAKKLKENFHYVVRLKTQKTKQCYIIQLTRLIQHAQYM